MDTSRLKSVGKNTKILDSIFITNNICINSNDHGAIRHYLGENERKESAANVQNIEYNSATSDTTALNKGKARRNAILASLKRQGRLRNIGS